MKSQKKTFLIYLLPVVFVLVAMPFFSQADSVSITNPFKSNTISGLIKVIVNDLLIPIGSVVAVVMIMYAGFMFVVARGDQTKITKAKDALLYAVIGAAILLGAWVISDVISGTITQLKT